MGWEEILAQSFFGNTAEQYLLAVGIFLGVCFISLVFKKYFLYIFRKAAAKTKIGYDDMIVDILESIRFPFFLIIAFYISLSFVQAPQIVVDSSYYLLLIGVIYYVVKALQATIDFFAEEYQKRSDRKSRLGGESNAVKYLSTAAKFMLWVFAGLFFLTNLGVEITPLIAGLGIGGIAIAFALQNILSDVFNYFSIYLDKPFMVGDFLIIGDDLGAVKKIGLRSTRIQTLRGEELIVSNNELTSTRIHNFKKMHERRITFTFGITYDTPVKKMEKIPGMVKKVIGEVKQTRFDRAHFKEFGNFSLNYEVVYYMLNPDYNLYMDSQQKINLGIMKAFDKAKIAFAYPTQMIYTKKA